MPEQEGIWFHRCIRTNPQHNMYRMYAPFTRLHLTPEPGSQQREGLPPTSHDERYSCLSFTALKSAGMTNESPPSHSTWSTILSAIASRQRRTPASCSL